MSSARSVVWVRGESDVAIARQRARELARLVQLSHVEIEAVATATSELARNLVDHAGGGELRFVLLGESGRRGIEVSARDEGPGIADPERVLQDGYASPTGLGLGLSSVKRMMDDFELESELGRGTTITFRKWTKELLR